MSCRPGESRLLTMKRTSAILQSAGLEEENFPHGISLHGSLLVSFGVKGIILLCWESFLSFMYVKRLETVLQLIWAAFLRAVLSWKQVRFGTVFTKETNLSYSSFPHPQWEYLIIAFSLKFHTAPLSWGLSHKSKDSQRADRHHCIPVFHGNILAL